MALAGSLHGRRGRKSRVQISDFDHTASLDRPAFQERVNNFTLQDNGERTASNLLPQSVPCKNIQIFSKILKFNLKVNWMKCSRFM